ncbi:hypothetical protein L596_005893 [Steinernema carpocapsae]|uniref:Uncharacterized protein n=1 Tax=Steinernema carpocapsae TaxID=34508 RepID=A0A4U8V1X1_STECR|nr:hypothetical protein L596_005893 [Steinernema carpocapsae]
MYCLKSKEFLEPKNAWNFTAENGFQQFYGAFKNNYGRLRHLRIQKMPAVLCVSSSNLIPVMSDELHLQTSCITSLGK